MTERETLACTLSGPELGERIQNWSRVASRATSRLVEKDRIVATYPRDNDLLQQLRKLIAAEADCCPFMQFTIKERPHEFEVELRVPDDMSEALAPMLARVTQGPGVKPRMALP